MEERAWLVKAKPHLGISCAPHGLPLNPFHFPPLLTICLSLQEPAQWDSKHIALTLLHQAHLKTLAILT